MAEKQGFGIDRDTFFHIEDDSERRAHLLNHICAPQTEDNPTIPMSPDVLDDIRNLGVPDAQIKKTRRRVFRDIEMDLPDAVAARATNNNRLIMWPIAWRAGSDDDDGTTSFPPTADDDVERYPSALMRTVQGDYVHAAVQTRSGPHTIHWHGFAPSPAHDGVGHSSFEIGGAHDMAFDGAFIYQYQTNQVGTYFYHCHKNTVLHFEMGMFGGFIVDPPSPDPNLPAPYWTGQGYVAGRLTNSPPGTKLLRYDKEQIWIVDDMDGKWHNTDGNSDPDHAHNMQACAPLDPAGADTFYSYNPTPASDEFNLNEFNPNIFAVSGRFLNYGQTGPGGTAQPSDYFTGLLDDGGGLINVSASVGEKVLIRFLNAAYTITELVLPVEGTIIAWDGQPLGIGGKHRYSRPYVVPAGTPIRTTTARRFDMIIDTARTGPFSGEGEIRYYHWVKAKQNGLIAVVQIPVDIV